MPRGRSQKSADGEKKSGNTPNSPRKGKKKNQAAKDTGGIQDLVPPLPNSGDCSLIVGNPFEDPPHGHRYPQQPPLQPYQGPPHHYPPQQPPGPYNPQQRPPYGGGGGYYPQQQPSHPQQIPLQHPAQHPSQHPQHLPPQQHPQQPPGQQYGMMNKHGPTPPMPPMGPHGPGKMYPPNQPMVFNPSNPNAPPIYPCGVCHKEVHDNDQAILCESGCNFWFHRACTGLTDIAYQMLTQEVYAEWVCDKCLDSKNIPMVKMKP